MNDASTQAIERYLAFGKGIKSVNSLIRRDAGRKMYDDLGIFSGIVIYTSYLYLTFFSCCGYRLYQTFRCSAVWYFGNDKSFLVDLRDACTYFNFTTLCAVIIITYIDETSGLKSGYSSKGSSLR